MTTKARKNKTTSFKLNDNYEKRMLEWAESSEKGDFSKYVKRLIARDMDNAERPQVAVYNPQPLPNIDETEDYEGYI